MAFLDNFLNPSLPMPGPRAPASSPRMPVMPTPPQPVMPVIGRPTPVGPIRTPPPGGQPIMPVPPRGGGGGGRMPELPPEVQPQPELDIERQIERLQAKRDQLKLEIENINNQIRELMMKQPAQLFSGNPGLGSAGKGIMDLLKGRGRGGFGD